MHTCKTNDIVILPKKSVMCDMITEHKIHYILHIACSLMS